MTAASTMRMGGMHRKRMLIKFAMLMLSPLRVAIR